MTTLIRRLRTPLAPTLLLAGLLAGCDRSGPVLAPAEPDGAPSLSAAPAGGLRDPGIDPGDTHFAVYVSTSRTAGALRSASAAVPSGGFSTSPDVPLLEAVYIEAGFGSDGEFRYNLYSEGDDDPRIPDPPRLVRAVGNAVSVYDAAGTLLGSFDFNTLLESAGFPGGDLAVGTPEGSIYNPLPGETDQSCVHCDAGPALSQAGGPHRRITRDGADILRIATRSPAAARTAAVAADAAPVAAPGETVRTYRRRIVATRGADGGRAPARPRSHWLLESVERTAVEVTPGGPREVRRRTTFRYVAGQVHRTRDDTRRSAPRPHPLRPSDARTRSGDDLPGAAPSVAGISLPSCVREGIDRVRQVSPSGVGIVYQHGFCADGDTWAGMRMRVPETHRVGREQIYSLDGVSRIDAQVDDLAARLTAQGVTGNVVVGHSQGGLVARRLGQRHPSLVSGVVTIGTPNAGALIADYPGARLSSLALLTERFCYGDLLCFLLARAEQEVRSGLITHGIDTFVPAAADDRPGSPFLQSLNTTHESFRRTSVAVSVPPRWALFRLLGDLASPPQRLLTDQPLDGAAYAGAANQVYFAARFLQHLAESVRWWVTDYGWGWGCHQAGYRSAWEPCYDPYGYAGRFWMASYWLLVADVLEFIGRNVTGILDWVDREWDYATTRRSDRTDGLIAYGSQQYPLTVPGTHTVRRFEIPASQESHSGETASGAVLRELRNALDAVQMPRN